MPSLAPRSLVLTLRLALALSLGLALPLGAQKSSEPKVSAQLSTGVARLGERIVLKITVENARNARLVQVPQADGLTFGDAEGPSYLQQMQSFNGRVVQTSQIGWALPVRATREGEFTIPPIGLEADGLPLETKPLRLRVVVDLRGADLGFLRIQPSSPKVVEGQPFTLELRFGWDEKLRTNYVDLSLPWWGAVPGLIEVQRDDTAPTAGSTDRIAINGEQGQARFEQVEPAADEAGRFVFRRTQTYIATRAGALEFPASVLEFSKLRESFFGPTEKEWSYFARAEPFTLEVVALPREGQPLDYSGAVGQLAARASADVRDVEVGESIKLAVEWTGQGNLEFFEAPDPKRIDAFRSFRVFGSTEEKRFDLRRVVYDLAPTDPSVSEIPALPLSVFDPVRGAYGTVATEPIPIRVRPLEKATALSAEEGARRFAADIEDIDPRPPAAAEGSGTRPGNRAVVAALALVPAGWLALRTAVRRRRGDPGAPLERRRRRARRELARALARSSEPRATLDAFQTYLAAREREAPEAWAGRDVAAWARTRADLPRASDAVAREVGELVLRLEAAVFGGRASVPGAELLAAAARWEEAGF